MASAIPVDTGEVPFLLPLLVPRQRNAARARARRAVEREQPVVTARQRSRERSVASLTFARVGAPHH